jgi:large subunit ribosomal protein L31
MPLADWVAMVRAKQPRRASDCREPGGRGCASGSAGYPAQVNRLVCSMKPGIHPEYGPSHVRCTCGNEFWTRSTKPELHVEICSNCHPFYTGRQKLVDTGGRVERFRRRAARSRSRR